MKPSMSNEEFRERIKAICGPRPKENKPCVRKPTDRGYYPPPKVWMKPGVIYSADNGQLICVHCAGISAKFTGRDISGHKITRMTQDDSVSWEGEFGKPLSCEGGCTSYRSMRVVEGREVSTPLALCPLKEAT